MPKPKYSLPRNVSAFRKYILRNITGYPAKRSERCFKKIEREVPDTKERGRLEDAFLHEFRKPGHAFAKTTQIAGKVVAETAIKHFQLHKKLSKQKVNRLRELTQELIDVDVKAPKIADIRNTERAAEFAQAEVNRILPQMVEIMSDAYPSEPRPKTMEYLDDCWFLLGLVKKTFLRFK